MRILHAPSNIANQPWAIAQGLRTLGHDVEVWHYGPNRFDFPADRFVPFPQVPGTGLLPLITEAIERFDVIHFHQGRSLIPRQQGWLPGLWDLPLLREAGKKIFFTFHGGDVWLPSAGITSDKWLAKRYADFGPREEDEIRKRTNVIRTYANGLFVCSPMVQPFVPDAGFHPRAIDLRDWDVSAPHERDVPVVVHTPSSRGRKGTDVILEGVERARARGLKFDFRLIEGVSNAQMRTVLRDADILVDNLLLGDYEVTGLEAMALGRTVVTRVLPAVVEKIGREVPILSADPDTFAEVFERAVSDVGLRTHLGLAGRRFVEEVHDAPVVARGLVAAYERGGDVGPIGFPDWASLGETRRVERLEAQVTELTAGLRARGKEVILAGTRRAPFTLAGARIDRALRRLRPRR